MSIHMEFSRILQDEVFEHADELNVVDNVSFSRDELLSDLERYQRFPRLQKPEYLSSSIYNVRQSMHNAFSVLLGEEHLPDEQQLERCAGLIVGEQQVWAISLQVLQPYNFFPTDRTPHIRKLAETALHAYLQSSLQSPRAFFSSQNDQLLQPQIENFVEGAKCTPRGKVLQAAEITASLAGYGIRKGVTAAANATIGHMTRQRPH